MYMCVYAYEEIAIGGELCAFVGEWGGWMAAFLRLHELFLESGGFSKDAWGMACGPEQGFHP
jgi:hypothetical protein